VLESTTLEIESTSAPAQPKRKVTKKRSDFSKIRDLMLCNLLIKQNSSMLLPRQSFPSVELS